MPLSQYDRYFGNTKGAARKALDAMRREYGAEKGERVFYATVAKRKKAKGARRSLLS